jgi:hypothetical protein
LNTLVKIKDKNVVGGGGVSAGRELLLFPAVIRCGGLDEGCNAESNLSIAFVHFDCSLPTLLALFETINTHTRVD